MITALLMGAAIAILAFGYYRARPFGKPGLLAWMQSAALMAPWMIFFGLSAAGIFVQLPIVLLMFVLSTGLYIYLGRQLRATGQNLLSQQAAQRATAAATTDTAERSGPSASGSEAVATSENLPDFTPIPDEDLRLMKGIFSLDTFFATETKPYQDGVIFRGNLRGEPEVVYGRLSENLAQQFHDRAPAPDRPLYRLFLVEEETKPIVVILPSANDPQPAAPIQVLLAIGLAIATLATSLETASFLQGFDLLREPSRLKESLPLSLGLVAILAAYQSGQRWMAHQRQVRLGPPFFIPTWQIGSFGALTRFESLLPNRKALFDVALAGPIASAIVSLVMLTIGLWFSQTAAPETSGLFTIPSQFFQGSVLVGTLARLVLGDALQASTVTIHPLVLLGWLGLVLTALNLMPAGQLDGGRVVQAIYGRVVARRATLATMAFLGIASFVNPLALYWAIVIIVLQRNLERPTLNDLAELDDTRAALGLLALFLTIATLVPLSPGLAGRLGIGG